MRKKITIFTAFIFLLSSTELHELARMPLLFGHYFHHQQEEPSLSLAGFIQLHYRLDHPTDNDDGEDQQLPFKSGIDSLKTDLTNTIFPEAGTGQYFADGRLVKTYYPEGVPCHQPYGIFHPPRKC